jgi:hypothetical protein
MSLMLLLHVDLNALDNNLIFSVGSFLGDGISSLILITTASEDETSVEVGSFII